MKNKPILKSSKSKFYHKLINNEVVYNNNSISRYIEDPSGNKIELIWYMNQERK